jgi:hypothetical protein
MRQRGQRCVSSFIFFNAVVIKMRDLGCGLARSKNSRRRSRHLLNKSAASSDSSSDSSTPKRGRS